MVMLAACVFISGTHSGMCYFAAQSFGGAKFLKITVVENCSNYPLSS